MKETLNSSARHFWLQDIRKVLQVLDDKDTWISSLQPPADTKLLPAGYILKLKRESNGLPVRFKARLVVHFQDDTNFDTYFALSAPVIFIDPVRLIPPIAWQKGSKVLHLDFKGAFLHPILPEGNKIWIVLQNII